MEKQNNPRVYPSSQINWNESIIQSRTVYESQEEGITLRDMYANSAMQIIERPKFFVGKRETEESHLVFAKFCYQIADAMLKARTL